MLNFKVKYKIEFFEVINNPPYNDAIFYIHKYPKRSYEDYEYIKIWTKHNKLIELFNKIPIYKDDILNACSIENQKKELKIILK